MERPILARSESWATLLILAALARIPGGSAPQPTNATATATAPAANRPIVVWASGPLDVVAAFDSPVAPDRANALVGQSIPYFELSNPPKNPAESDRPAGALRIMGVEISDAGRTLKFATDPHPRLARYILPLPGRETSSTFIQPRDSGAEYGLFGVEWGFSPDSADAAEAPQATGWWPSLDVDSTKRLTAGSLPHQRSLALFAQPGRLVLSALLALPAGKVTVRLESTAEIDEAILGESQGEPAAESKPEKLHRVELLVDSKSKDEPLFLSFRARTGPAGRPFQLRASYRQSTEQKDVALDRNQMILPWAPIPPAAAAAAPLVLPDLSGGDAVRGQKLFNGDQARCSLCHTFRGLGAAVGPDLTEIGKKGRAEIYRSIAAPSAAIEPDYTSFTVASKNGAVAVGLVRAIGPTAIRVTDTNARSTVVERDQIEQIRPSGTSIMPVGLAALLGDAAARDLIAFLTSEPPAKPRALP